MLDLQTIAACLATLATCAIFSRILWEWLKL